MSAVRNLVAEIVDYAGLYPPASLPLPVVVENFAIYLQSGHSWMLARLILPLGKLDEFQQQDAFLTSTKKWRISALVTAEGFSDSLKTIERFNERHAATDGSRTVIDAIEVKVSTVDEIDRLARHVPRGMNAFLEIPHDPAPDQLIERIAAGDDHLFAKIRTGGVTDDLIPSAMEVARFISLCARYKTGFKATAGLHHPLRGRYFLTYDNDAECGTMFGFINVFVAACCAFTNQVSGQALESILNETEPAAFSISDDSISWRGISVSVGQVAETRKKFAMSFGSCSFVEPTSGLAELGWLGQ